MILRKVSLKDYNKIRSLFNRNNLEIIEFGRWKNLWSNNPSLKGKKKWIKGWIMEKNKTIVGHFGSFPAKYLLNNKSYLCSVLYGWVVDRKFRSQSILLLKKIFIQSNIDFFLGTTTNPKAGKIMEALNARQVPVESLGYSLFVILNLRKVLKFAFKTKKFIFKNLLLNLATFFLSYIFKKKINSWKSKFHDRNIVKCKKIDSRFNFIWKRIKKSYKNMLLFQRDKNWLKWHINYFLKNNRAWILFDMQNNKINGYSICIETNNYKDGIKRAFLVDLISLSKDKNALINLIGASINEAKKRNCDIIEFRGFNKLIRTNIKFFSPFKKKLSSNPFYYKSNNYKLDKMLRKDNCWNPSYIDGDAIINF